MIKARFFLILLIIFNLKGFAESSQIEIKVKIQSEIITNIDIENEKNYLIFFNPKLIELDDLRIQKVSRDSLISEIIKKNELKKFFDLSLTSNIVNEIEKKILRNKNIKTKSDFIKILKNNNLSYEIVKEKLQIEALWNQLVYKKFINNIKINKDELKKNILDQYTDKEKIYEYNLSEIVFQENLDKTYIKIFNDIKKNINEIGFENTANIYSISNTSRNGGLIGWINELQLSKKINNKIKDLSINQISEPIKIQNGYILLKLNKKKEFKQEINLDEQLKTAVNEETNRQLNNFSTIFYKRLKRNIEINEY